MWGPQVLLAWLKLLASTSTCEPVFLMAGGKIEVLSGWRPQGAQEVVHAGNSSVGVS